MSFRNRTDESLLVLMHLFLLCIGSVKQAVLELLVSPSHCLKCPKNPWILLIMAAWDGEQENHTSFCPHTVYCRKGLGRIDVIKLESHCFHLPELFNVDYLCLLEQETS